MKTKPLTKAEKQAKFDKIHYIGKNKDSTIVLEDDLLKLKKDYDEIKNKFKSTLLKKLINNWYYYNHYQELTKLFFKIYKKSKEDLTKNWDKRNEHKENELSLKEIYLGNKYKWIDCSNKLKFCKKERKLLFSTYDHYFNNTKGDRKKYREVLL